MAQMTFYPDADPETSSVDGRVRQQSDPVAWSVIRAAAGTHSKDNGTTASISFGHTTQGGGGWTALSRLILLFDISALPSGATITGATLRVRGYAPIDPLVITPDINVYSSSPASNTGLVAADFTALGSTPLSDAIAFVDYLADANDDFVLNAAGLTIVTTAQSGDGIVKLGLRNANYDVSGVVPTTSVWGITEVGIYCAESDYPPQLIITYTAAPTIPLVTTDAATSITQTTAQINGTLDDDGGATCTCNLDWGLTTAYGSTTPNLSRTTGQTFLGLLSGLTPGTTYHFRAKADNGTAIGYGADRTFTTLGTIYPTEDIRVAGLIHRASRGAVGEYSLEVILGGLSSEFITPIRPPKPIPTVPSPPPPSTRPITDNPVGSWYGYNVYYDGLGFYVIMEGRRQYIPWVG